MTTASVDEQEDLQVAAARIRAMRPDELDAASPAQVRQMLETMRAARLAAEAQAAAEQAAAAERRQLLDELRLGADADFVASARAAAAAGEPSTRRTAAEYKTWSDERIALQYLDPEVQLAERAGIPVEQLGVTQPVPEWLQDDEEEFDEPSPLFFAFDQLSVAQAESNRADAARVGAALTAWRTAEALATGTAQAAMNGPYFHGVIMQIAHDLQIAHPTAVSMVRSADELERGLPQTWRRFARGEVPWRAMQRVHSAIDGLDPEYLAAFDAAAAELVVDVPVPKLKDRLHTLRERLQTSTAPERHERAKRGMRVEIEPAPDGMAWISALVPAAEAVHIDRMLDLAARQAAAEPGEERSISVLRAVIFGDVFAEWLGQDASTDRDNVLVPRRRGVQCKVGLLIPAMTAMGHSDVPAVLEGYGPIDIETAKRLAGDATSWIKVLTDPVTGAVWDVGRDKYRPSSDMRTLLGLLDGGGRGPGCRRPPSQTEADHVEPFWQHFARGKTALDNLVLLSRRDHGVKTSGIWDIELRSGRDLAWTSIAGTRIITRVEPLEPTPVPAQFLPPAAPPRDDAAAADWADPEESDDLDLPF